MPIRLDSPHFPTILPKGLKDITEATANLHKPSSGWVKIVQVFASTVQITNLQALLFNSLRTLPFHVKIRIVRPRLDIYKIRLSPRIGIHETASGALHNLVDLGNAGCVKHCEVRGSAHID